MKVEDKVEVEISKKELTKIIIDYLRERGIGTDDICYNVKNVYSGGYGDRDDGSPELVSVSCVGKRV